MIKESHVYLNWNGRNKDHYIALGYQYTKHNDKFCVNINDLTIGSHAQITGVCDVCGKEKTMKYKTYIICFNKFGFYCCDECSHIKRTKTNNIRYGVDNAFQSLELQEKSRATNIKKYGVPYITQSEDWKNQYAYGNKNTFWIDGRNVLCNKRNNSKLKSWRRSVYLRDNYTCRCCGDNDKINAHHIYNYSDNEDSIYDVDNGITLCKKCHIAFHKQYGYKTDYSQLMEWLKERCNDYRKDMSIRDIRQNNQVE